MPKTPGRDSEKDRTLSVRSGSACGTWSRRNGRGGLLLGRRPTVGTLAEKHIVTEDEAAALRSEFRQEPRQDQLPPQTQGSVPKKVPGPSQVDVTSNSGGNPADKPSPQVPREDALLSHIPLRISGYVQSRWTAAPGTNDPLEIRRARLSLDGDLAK